MAVFTLRSWSRGWIRNDEDNEIVYRKDHPRSFAFHKHPPSGPPSARNLTLHAPWMRERFMDYGELFRDRVALAATVSGPDIIQTVRRRRVLCQEMGTAMDNLDIIVSAAQPAEAPRIADVTKWANMEKPSFTMPFNVTGFPAISVCTGFGEGGLPVSMQLVGKPFSEPIVFRAAHAYEAAMPWRARRPEMT